MSIQGLLQKGNEKCSILEKAADVLLTLPRIMWLGRDVKVKSETVQNKLAKSLNNFLANNFERVDIYDSLGLKEAAKDAYVESTLLTYMSVPAYILGTALAAPLLGLGLLCKKISLLKDSKANDYHKLIEAVIKDSKLLHKKEKLEKTKHVVDGFIEEIQKQLDHTKIPETATENAKKLFIEKSIAPLELNISKLKSGKENLDNRIRSIDKQREPAQKKVDEAFKEFNKNITYEKL